MSPKIDTEDNETDEEDSYDDNDIKKPESPVSAKIKPTQSNAEDTLEMDDNNSSQD